jgi:hypothetical protein
MADAAIDPLLIQTHPAPTSAEIVRALKVHALQHQMAGTYSRILREFVFARAGCLGDLKRSLSYKRTLDTSEAGSILTFLWKDSLFVSDDELSSAGLLRSFSPSRLTVHSLAVSLAETPGDVAATNSRVRLIVSAGAAFGLIDRSQVSRNKTLISGSELLHQFMIRLGIANVGFCAGLAPDVEGMQQGGAGHEN